MIILSSVPPRSSAWCRGLNQGKGTHSFETATSASRAFHSSGVEVATRGLD